MLCQRRSLSGGMDVRRMHQGGFESQNERGGFLRHAWARGNSNSVSWIYACDSDTPAMETLPEVVPFGSYGAGALEDGAEGWRETACRPRHLPDLRVFRAVLGHLASDAIFFKGGDEVRSDGVGAPPLDMPPLNHVDRIAVFEER